MSVIILPILYVGSQGETTMMTKFDSGVNLSCINPLYLNKIGTPVKGRAVRKIYTDSEGHYIEVDSAICLQFFLEGVLLSDEFFIAPGLSEVAIIGATTMRKWRIEVDNEHGQVHVDPNKAKLQLKISIPYLVQ